ncbi:hypothetical protein XAC3810_610008 [Xanthomonas citri pv. citri]|nr:hypothetical protein HZS93_03510 [Xanthomonas citri]CEE34239.1 hypothetical protein XAC9322_590001 [Xanthomonas citri pv. citri]CEE34487.1 hypothetical protein XAC3824_780010 [Xanthomonas citri pv. citri]CEE35743.1 hypothetical protein XAC1083_610008 [Xanthomonas citri pv. citri]CEE45050.1 hypothetical protein XAC3810_610008 [Xanthomonas citri pv. citri]
MTTPPRRTGTVAGWRRDVGRLETASSRRAYSSRRSVVLAALPTQERVGLYLQAGTKNPPV